LLVLLLQQLYLLYRCIFIIASHRRRPSSPSLVSRLCARAPVCSGRTIPPSSVYADCRVPSPHYRTVVVVVEPRFAFSSSSTGFFRFTNRVSVLPVHCSTPNRWRSLYVPEERPRYFSIAPGTLSWHYRIGEYTPARDTHAIALLLALPFLLLLFQRYLHYLRVRVIIRCRHNRR